MEKILTKAEESVYMQEEMENGEMENGNPSL